MRRVTGSILLGLLLVPAAVIAVAAQGQSAVVAPTFATGTLPPAPNAGLLTTNEDAEPGLAVDGGGTLWAASNILPFATHDKRRWASGLLSGSDVWKSADDGTTWQWVGDPIAPVAGQAGGMGGEDTDIAAAPEKNAKGFYNVYVASLWVGATDLAVSQDGGATWTEYQLGGIPVQDRPWLAAAGPCTVYMSYHQFLPTYDTVVDRYDVCTAGRPIPTGEATALDPVSSADAYTGGAAPGLTNRFGKLVVDNSPTSPNKGAVYQPMDLCRDDLTPTNPEIQVTGCNTNTEIVMAVSTDGGLTFTDYTVARTGTQNVYIWPVTVAVDSAGNVYAAWFDSGVAYLNVSHDGGKTWSPSARINQTGSAVYPTLAAGGPGELFVAWYGTDRTGASDDVSIMGQPNKANAAQWHLYAARSADYGQTFVTSVATGVIHTGVLCPQGGGCGRYAGDRNLLDDFGVQIDPITGLASVVFTNDQPGGKSGTCHTDFAKELPPLTP